MKRTVVFGLCLSLLMAGCVGDADVTPTPVEQTPTNITGTDTAKIWQLEGTVYQLTNQTTGYYFSGQFAIRSMVDVPGELRGVEIRFQSRNRTVLETHHVGTIREDDRPVWVNRTIPSNTRYIVPQIENITVPDDFTGGVMAFEIFDDGVTGPYWLENASEYTL